MKYTNNFAQFFIYDKNFIGLGSLSFSYLGSNWIIFEHFFIYLYLGTLALILFRFGSFHYSKYSYIDYAPIQSCLLFLGTFALALANLSFGQSQFLPAKMMYSLVTYFVFSLKVTRRCQH
jgi:hypothetical protein